MANHIATLNVLPVETIEYHVIDYDGQLYKFNDEVKAEKFALESQLEQIIKLEFGTSEVDIADVVSWMVKDCALLETIMTKLVGCT